MQDELKATLTGLGLSDEQIEKLKAQGVVEQGDMALLSAAEVQETTACGLVVAKKVAAKFAPVVDTSHNVAMMSSDFGQILPKVPDDASFLRALQTGGVLKVEQSTVISAIRAALASRVGLYNVPAKLVRQMEAFTEETEEQVGPEFYKMRKLLMQSTYGDLFEAMDGMDGKFVTQTRKDELLKRISDYLWPAVVDFNRQLSAWQDAWMKGASNPAMMMMLVLGRGAGGTMPPGLGQAPDTGILRDAALAVNDACNKVFRGTGVQISAALAYEANRIKETLENSDLPRLVGAANRDQMLKKIGVAVPATYPRLETNLTQFVLGIMAAETQPAGEDELRYFGALQLLGAQIDGAFLSGGVVDLRPEAGIGRASSSRRAEPRGDGSDDVSMTARRGM